MPKTHSPADIARIAERILRQSDDAFPWVVEPCGSHESIVKLQTLSGVSFADLKALAASALARPRNKPKKKGK